MSFAHNQPAWEHHGQHARNHQVHALTRGPHLRVCTDDAASARRAMNATVEQEVVPEGMEVVEARDHGVARRQLMFDLTQHHLLARKLLQDRGAHDALILQTQERLAALEAFLAANAPKRLLRKVDRRFKDRR
ncbi:hypothetical protein SS50377_27173 [Spironucleus salmonicida]|uniref:Uncharacterized protein n=1 Tax=Spironucleus salmonicida TaxID=348837 RepID=A0A9P8LMG5_9EUKA|nr:hypothetical protein SS50377_27166 [Spironucleus salmonicida]KAH0570880.1 hypothetical protein SS50377_27173 [Spironucleus salmonicida]